MSANNTVYRLSSFSQIEPIAKSIVINSLQFIAIKLAIKS